MQNFLHDFRLLQCIVLAVVTTMPVWAINAQSSPPAAVLGAAADPSGRSLLVRVPSTRTESVSLQVQGQPVAVTSSQPALLEGMEPTHELVLEMAAFCQQPAECAQPIQGLQRAVEATFNPGERLVVRASTDHPTLSAQTDLEQIRASIQGLVRAVPEPGAVSGLHAAAGAELRTLTIVARLSLAQSMVQSFTAQPPLYPAHVNVLIVGSPAAETDTLCQQVAATGGLCRAAVDPARAPEMLQALLEDVQRIERVSFACVTPPDDVDRSAVVAVQTAGGTSSALLPGEQVWCAPLPEPTRVIPVWVWAIAGGGGSVLLLGLLMLMRRRPVVEGVSPLDGLPDNHQAWVRQHPETVDDRPDWLPDPVLHAAREQLRSAILPVPPQGLLVWISSQQPGQAPMPPTGAMEIGGTGGVPLSSAAHAAIARLVRSAAGQAPTLELASPEIGARVRVNGRPAQQGQVLRPGDEVSVDSMLLLEFRMPATEAATRIEFNDSRAFSSLTARSTTTVLGRDPLRYQGVTPVESQVKIDRLSSDHVALWLSGGVLYVRDLGSANGTCLDGVRLQAYAVYPVMKGQRLELGAVVDGIAE